MFHNVISRIPQDEASLSDTEAVLTPPTERPPTHDSADESERESSLEGIAILGYN
jgi:hypothetical protein